VKPELINGQWYVRLGPFQTEGQAEQAFHNLAVLAESGGLERLAIKGLMTVPVDILEASAVGWQELQERHGRVSVQVDGGPDKPHTTKLIRDTTMRAPVRVKSR
jgi:hypothetical protein